MSAVFTLYGWELSYFSAKARCYLRYKRVPFVEKPVDLPTLTLRIPEKTGAVVMPVVVTPEGEWIQDTSVIIDRLEERFPARAVVPATPVRRFVSYVLEAWGDEWWIPFAMHTRWSHPENAVLFEREAGAGLLPWAPAFVQRRVARIPMQSMRRHLPGLGVEPAQLPVLDAWLEGMLDLLDTHFAALPFLLGHRPSLGDFALVGPLYAHLGRDPWSKRALIAPRRHLRAWIDRMLALPNGGDGDWLAGDAIPETLVPVLRAVFREFTPLLAETSRAVRAALPSLPPGKALPRGLGPVAYPVGAGTHRRAALPYVLWMVQRSLDVFGWMDGGEQAAVRSALSGLGGTPWLELDIPRLRRVGLRVAPEVVPG